MRRFRNWVAHKSAANEVPAPVRFGRINSPSVGGADCAVGRNPIIVIVEDDRVPRPLVCSRRDRPLEHIWRERLIVPFPINVTAKNGDAEFQDRQWSAKRAWGRLKMRAVDVTNDERAICSNRQQSSIAGVIDRARKIDCATGGQEISPPKNCFPIRVHDKKEIYSTAESYAVLETESFCS